MIYDTKLFLVSLLPSIIHPTFGLQQFTPIKADWSTFQTKVPGGNHDINAIDWISEDQWVPWNGEIYDPRDYSRAEFAEKICPAGGNTVRGLRELFYDSQPFVDNTNPTKAEVDNWHMVVLKHIRALVGYYESEYPIQPDPYLHARALFSQERHRTNIWDAKYPDGNCVGSTNEHCGASFVPTIEDQEGLEGYLEFLPDGQSVIDPNGLGGGSEGISSAGKANIPWSIKWVRPLCSFLASEGFWGGHMQPFFVRSEFGWSWRDIDPNDPNSNTQVRLKWGGNSAPQKYENPLKDKVLIDVTEPYGVNPNATYVGYECIVPDNLKPFDTYFTKATDATDCYRQVMEEDKCGKRFLTFGEQDKEGDGLYGCACYPPQMESCNSTGQPDRRTWDFRPVSYSFGGLSVDITKTLRQVNQLPWIDRECENVKYVTNAASLSQCLEKLVEADFKFCVDGFQYDCEKNVITWNANADGGNECGCYPLNSQTSDICITGRNKASGRRTYELEADLSFVPGGSTTPSNALNCPTRSPTMSPLPSATPSQAPSTSLMYYEGYYIDTTEDVRLLTGPATNVPMPWEKRNCPGDKVYQPKLTGPSDIRECVKYLVENNFQVQVNGVLIDPSGGTTFSCSKTLLTYIPEKRQCVFYQEGTPNCLSQQSNGASGRLTYDIRFFETVSPTTSPTALPTVTPTSFPTKNPTSSPTKFPTQFPTLMPSVSTPTASVQPYSIDTFETKKVGLWSGGTYNSVEESRDLTAGSNRNKKLQTKKNTIPSPSEGKYKAIQIKLDVEYISENEYEGVKLQLDAIKLRDGNKKKRKIFRANEFNTGQRVALEHEFSQFEVDNKKPWFKLTLGGMADGNDPPSHTLKVQSIEINFLY